MNSDRAFANGVPIVFGVTGHRTLDNYDNIKRELQGWLSTAVEEKYKNSPFVLMTALAEGFDRLAARAVCELEPELRKRICLQGILPMPAEEYRRDWRCKSKSDEEFLELLAKCDEVVELPLSYKAEGERGNLERLVEERLEAEREGECGAQYKKGSLRNKRYALVGSYIARHSHVLIAGWDGVEDIREGGTRWVIEDFEAGCALTEYRKEYTGVAHDDVLIPDLSSLRQDNKLGTVLHILTPRESTTGNIGNVSVEFRCGGDWPEYLSDIDKFNGCCSDSILQAARESIVNHSAIEEIGSLTGDEARHIRRLEAIQASADYMSIDHQNIAFWRFVMVSGLALVALGIFIGIDRLELSQYFNYVFIFLAIIIGCMKLYFTHCRPNHLMHLQYRSLAEGLRIQTAWLRAGLHSSIVDGYPKKYIRDLGWVPHALRGIHAGIQPTKPQELDLCRVSHVRKHWIDAQQDYLSRKIETFAVKGPNLSQRQYFPKIQGYKPILHFFEAASNILKWVASLFVMWLIVSEIPFFDDYLPDISTTVGWFLFVLPLAISLALRRFVDGMGLKEELEWYECTERSFDFAKKNLEGDIDIEMAAQVLLKLGNDIAHENAAWVDLHRRNDLFGSVKCKD